MNVPPTEFIRVPHTDLYQFVERACLTVNMPPADAALLAQLLTDNDLRGVVSHGTQQIATYARLMREGILNPTPNVHIAKETPVSTIYDGDGGLGYFAAYKSTLATIEKAKQQGIAIGQSRNHGHFGAAGIYTRLMLGHDLLGYVTSGHQLLLEEGAPYVTAAGGSPHSFLSPANSEQSMILDFGAIHDMYVSSPHRQEIERIAPAVVFRSVGLGAICQSWGGFLAGVPFDTKRSPRTWEGANQGSLAIAFRIDLFISPEQFKAEMDEYIQNIAKLEPIEGYSESLLPGAIEAQRDSDYRAQGIPVGPQHRERLEGIAEYLDIQVPW
ncbi:MAG: Ldh family oxidoreductase [Caldilineaceae bacterium]|nr:Ldh family oxidoreductase [Caldilineaceae bacterium]